jgi:hypothetical protein
MAPVISGTPFFAKQKRRRASIACLKWAKRLELILANIKSSPVNPRTILLVAWLKAEGIRLKAEGGKTTDD